MPISTEIYGATDAPRETVTDHKCFECGDDLTVVCLRCNPLPTASPPPPAGDMVLVPREALDWLFGQGPDAQGYWFGDYEDNSSTLNENRPEFWWRRKFRAMLAASPLPTQEVSDGWQMIEFEVSPPHSQKVLLGWFEPTGVWNEIVGPASWGWRNETANNISHHGSATHWRPLPAPPESALRTGERKE